MNIRMTSGSGPDQGPQYGLQCNSGQGHQHAPGYCRTTDIHMNLQLQHRLGQQTMDKKVVSRANMDHRGLWRRTNQKMNPSSSWTSRHCSELRQQCGRAACLRAESEYKLQALHITLSALPFPCQQELSVNACHHRYTSSSASFHRSLHSSIFSTHPLNSCLKQ